MGVTDPAIDLLLTRLRWPVPRVRLEASRSIARLIRAGDQQAADALLRWISNRTFESEAIIGLCIIDAFDLGSFFKFTDVRDAVKAPSHLSDALLVENFGSDSGLWPFRYRYAPDAKAELNERIRARFSEFNGVPQMFHSRLQYLQDRSGAPFLRRWQHEWEWLQTRDLRAEGNPSFFFHGERNSTGQFDFGDRETYVSAFLRTLAFAASEWDFPHDTMAYMAKGAITLNRGLADVDCIERPTWSDDILVRDRSPSVAAQHVWDQAKLSILDNSEIAALRVAELTETAFVSYQFHRAVGVATGFEAARRPREQSGLFLPQAQYAGPVPENTKPQTFDRPINLCGMTMPMDVGRMLVDVVPHVQLPGSLWPGAAEMSTPPDSVVLSMSDRKFATWRYWYSDWDPAVPKGLDSLVGYMTTIDVQSLRSELVKRGLASGVWCQVKWGTREYAYSEFDEGREGFWLERPFGAGSNAPT